MRLTNLLTQEVILLRQSSIGTDKIALSTVTGVLAEIQPIDDDKTSIDEGVFGKTFAMYTDGDISLYPGDTLRDRSGNKYTVKAGGATSRQHGRIGFSKIILELTD